VRRLGMAFDSRPNAKREVNLRKRRFLPLLQSGIHGERHSCRFTDPLPSQALCTNNHFRSRIPHFVVVQSRSDCNHHWRQFPPKGGFAQIILSRPKFVLFVVLQACSHCNQHWRQFSLTLWERAGVRGKVMNFYPTQKSTISLSNYDLLCNAPKGDEGLVEPSVRFWEPP
jgi:hypothetical protein